MQKNIAIIGSGFSGLTCACLLAKEGHNVTIFEKNATIGGRARVFQEKGFVFDMGPSWYWMPDVFETFYNQFQKTTQDFYTLQKLDPGFQIIFDQNQHIQIPAQLNLIANLFESIEKGSAKQLIKFLDEAEWKYKTSMQKFIYNPSYSFLEFINTDILKSLFKLHLFTPMSKYVRKYFKHPHLIALMEFPVLFLGAMPSNIPALYSLMNYAALSQGTFYPQGGMFQVVHALQQLAHSLGIHIKTNAEVTKINVHNNLATSLQVASQQHLFDLIVAAADYHFVEQHLLEKQYQNYSPLYWQKKELAPSALIFYLGINKKLPALQHHNLFFDASLQQHSHDIYTQKQWPQNPLFYLCCPSKTDPSVAPPNHENLFILMPLASGLQDTPQLRTQYFNLILKRIEKHIQQPLQNHIIYQKSYCVQDFQNDYHAFKGNAYGLANTLLQTGPLKPTIKNKKIPNLFYTGQLTVPGPGMPPAFISGQIVANQVLQYFNKK